MTEKNIKMFNFHETLDLCSELHSKLYKSNPASKKFARSNQITFFTVNIHIHVLVSFNFKPSLLQFERFASMMLAFTCCKIYLANAKGHY